MLVEIEGLGWIDPFKVECVCDDPQSMGNACRVYFVSGNYRRVDETIDTMVCRINDARREVTQAMEAWK